MTKSETQGRGFLGEDEVAESGRGVGLAWDSRSYRVRKGTEVRVQLGLVFLAAIAERLPS